MRRPSPENNMSLLFVASALLIGSALLMPGVFWLFDRKATR